MVDFFVVPYDERERMQRMNVMAANMLLIGIR